MCSGASQCKMSSRIVDLPIVSLNLIVQSNYLHVHVHNAADNPVSCLVTLHLFALPALRKMAGHRQHLTTVVTAELL